MIEVVIIGYGNVGSHLTRALSNASGAAILQVYARTLPKDHLDQPLEFTQDISEIKKADVYIVAVPDDAVTEVTAQLPFRDQLVVHSSGGAPMSSIDKQQRRGVFYPLQSFSKQTAVDYHTIPICVEAEHREDEELLTTLGATISKKVVSISSEDRAQLHLAAVFVNNFVNHLYHVSEGLLAKKEIDFDLIKPLILETARKVQLISPSEAQTGPALRQDINTIKKHVDLLEDESLQGIYAFFTKAIHESNNQE